jgi:hypothetical protein
VFIYKVSSFFSFPFHVPPLMRFQLDIDEPTHCSRLCRLLASAPAHDHPTSEPPRHAKSGAKPN